VLPFSGWDHRGGYNNGLQLIEFSPTTLTTAGAGRTRGWVERGIFVGDRLVSLSDVALAVIDYADPMAPSVVTELTLARNVVTALPNGSTPRRPPIPATRCRQSTSTASTRACSATARSRTS
jgi:hypothetical protein